MVILIDYLQYFSFFYNYSIMLLSFILNLYDISINIMDKVKLYDKTFKTFILYDRLKKAIDEVADKINADFNGCEDIPVLLCVLNGSIMFTSELMKRLTFNCQIVSTKLTSYEGTNTTGKVKQAMGLTADIKGRRVIIVEDIVDSGNTIVELKRILQEKEVAESRICTLLLKPEAYKKDVKIDYVAMEIPNDFIVGFGLDYDELGRNLRDIYVLEQ